MRLAQEGLLGTVLKKSLVHALWNDTIPICTKLTLTTVLYIIKLLLLYDDTKTGFGSQIMNI